MAGIVSTLFLYLVFFINWFLWLGAWIAQVGRDAVTSNNLIGVVAFFAYNLNFVIFIGITLGTIGYMYFGANAQ